MRKALHDEGRKNFVIAGQLRGQRIELVINVEHDADRQEERELKEHDKTAEYQSFLTLAFVSAGQQSLHQQLIRAVRSHGQKRSPQQACPESKRHAEIQFERNDLKFA